MSKEREVNVIGEKGGVETRDLLETDITEAEKKEAKRARYARVLERGFVVDRLTVDNLPANLYGEWVPRDPIEIERKKALGFWIDKEYAPKRALHSDGSDTAIVADCIFMVCQREDKELIDEIRREQYDQMHGSPRKDERRGQKEEKDFTRQVLATDTPTPVIDEGAERVARRTELEKVLK